MEQGTKEKKKEKNKSSASHGNSNNNKHTHTQSPPTMAAFWATEDDRLNEEDEDIKRAVMGDGPINVVIKQFREYLGPSPGVKTERVLLPIWHEVNELKMNLFLAVLQQGNFKMFTEMFKTLFDVLKIGSEATQRMMSEMKDVQKGTTITLEEVLREKFLEERPAGIAQRFFDSEEVTRAFQRSFEEGSEFTSVIEWIVGTTLRRKLRTKFKKGRASSTTESDGGDNNNDERSRRIELELEPGQELELRDIANLLNQALISFQKKIDPRDSVYHFLRGKQYIQEFKDLLDRVLTEDLKLAVKVNLKILNDERKRREQKLIAWELRQKEEAKYKLNQAARSAKSSKTEEGAEELLRDAKNALRVLQESLGRIRNYKFDVDLSENITETYVQYIDDSERLIREIKDKIEELRTKRKAAEAEAKRKAAKAKRKPAKTKRKAKRKAKEDEDEEDSSADSDLGGVSEEIDDSESVEDQPSDDENKTKVTDGKKEAKDKSSDDERSGTVLEPKPLSPVDLDKLRETVTSLVEKGEESARKEIDRENPGLHLREVKGYIQQLENLLKRYPSGPQKLAFEINLDVLNGSQTIAEHKLYNYENDITLDAVRASQSDGQNLEEQLELSQKALREIEESLKRIKSYELQYDLLEKTTQQRIDVIKDRITKIRKRIEEAKQQAAKTAEAEEARRAQTEREAEEKAEREAKEKADREAREQAEREAAAAAAEAQRAQEEARNALGVALPVRLRSYIEYLLHTPKREDSEDIPLVLRNEDNTENVVEDNLFVYTGPEPPPRNLPVRSIYAPSETTPDTLVQEINAMLAAQPARVIFSERGLDPDSVKRLRGADKFAFHQKLPVSFVP